MENNVQNLINNYLRLMDTVEEELNTVYNDLNKTGMLYASTEKNEKLKKLQTVLKQLDEKYEEFFKEENKDMSNKKYRELEDFYFVAKNFATPLVKELNEENGIC